MLLLIEPRNRAILMVSSSKEIPVLPFPSVWWTIVSSVSKSSCITMNIHFFLLIKIEHWLGPITVCLCLLYVMLVCVSFLYCGELTQCVCSVVFVGFRDKEIVCGIHVSFWPISIVCAVCLARFVSSSVSTY